MTERRSGMLEDFRAQRRNLVWKQMQRQGVRDRAVLEAMEAVPREEFVPAEQREFAYRNVPLPIGWGQTISQPFVIAFMAEALELEPGDRVLEIGTGSGYAAAVLAELAGEVDTIERHRELAETARVRLERLGYDNVHLLCGDGTRGWPDRAPYDGIVVAAGGPDVPKSLREQLAVGGRLVIPVGSGLTSQRLLRVTRVGEDEYEEEDFGGVAFVPLIGEEGWPDNDPADTAQAAGPVSLGKKPAAKASGEPDSPATLIREAAEPFGSIDECDFGPLLDRIGEARLVLIGEATHGTSEFYRMRAEITKALIRERDFDFVAVEADWPDAARVGDYVTRRQAREGPTWEAFSRFPTWMWRNGETLAFIEWLREHNLDQPDPTRRTAFYGLDLYNLFASIRAVLDYLDRVDPQAARVARERYGCLTPWEGDPATYGRAALTGRYRDCEREVVEMLRDLLARQAEYSRYDGEQFMDAALNARLVAAAEEYYRVMYYGSVESWNHRDRHMFETLEQLLNFHGGSKAAAARAVLWAHNSHLGDAAATQVGNQGEINVGQLCRERFGEAAYLIGQATDTGTVAAAPAWDEPMEVMTVRPALEGSYERLCHGAGVERFFLPLRQPKRSGLREALEPSRLERAIGVIYRPQTERQSHYFRAALPRQFDELIWFDRTEAVAAIAPQDAAVHPPHHPFATLD